MILLLYIIFYCYSYNKKTHNKHICFVSILIRSIKLDKTLTQYSVSASVKILYFYLCIADWFSQMLVSEIDYFQIFQIFLFHNFFFDR